ncbi:Alpha-amylase [Plasmodiophora brassicae]
MSLAPAVVAVSLLVVIAQSQVYLQTFDWESISDRPGHMRYLKTQVSSWASAGFHGAWLPPQSESVDAQGYIPQRWYRLVDHDSLVALLQDMNSRGMVGVADIVINHRGAPHVDPCTHEYTAFQEPDMGNWAVVADDYKCNSGDRFCQGDCGCGNFDTGDNFCPSPDLDHTNDGVRRLVKEYLHWLKSVGFKGWRFDMAIGYDARFNAEYVRDSQPEFSVGEVWSDTDRVWAWIQGAQQQSSAFDFPYRSELKSAVTSNDYSWLKFTGIVSRNSLYACTFLDNHDTARDDRFGDRPQIVQGYAVILTHPGTPFVFWKDWEDDYVREPVQALMDVRASSGISSTSPLYIDVARHGLYAAYVHGGKGTVAVKTGSDDWIPNPQHEYSLYTSGHNFAVWVRTAT